MKIKLIQYLVKELCLIGIQLDILLCCCEILIMLGDKCKIGQFCNVCESVVIEGCDVCFLYDVLLEYYCQGFD